MENRIEILRNHIDNVLLNMTDTFERRCACLHLYGVSQTCALIALKRGENAELAMIAGLVYRKFDEKDFPIVFDWTNNAENMKYREEPLNESQTRGYLKWLISNTDAEDVVHCEYAVVRKSDNKLIGSSVLMHLPDNPEIGWTLHRDYWRQGYGTEMGIAMLNLGFNTLNLHRIIAKCHAQNIGSYKIMEKIGMRREAYFIKSEKGNSVFNHEWCDEVQYAILLEEWKQTHE